VSKSEDIEINPKADSHPGAVKASNFGPDGNFGLFLVSSVASVDEACTKNEQN
jgi:hypothetical protein